MTLALAGGRVLTSLDPVRLIDADVVVEGGRIRTIGPAPDGSERLDCEGCLVIPGNVCAHTHLYSSLARGMPYSLEPPANFVQILQRVWWRLDRALDEESIRASALVGGMEALLAGTTTVIDHHASPNAIDGSLELIAGALEEVGIRSVLCYEATDRDGQDCAMAGVQENRRFLGGAGDRRLARGMVGAHASFTLSPETLEACVELARATGTGIHIHVAEDFADQADSEVRFGASVVKRLAGAGALTPQALLAHCVYLSPPEIRIVVDAGVTVAHNARSNMNNSVGRTLVEGLGDRVALGTDGIGADMFEESHTAHWRAREAAVFAQPTETLARLARGSRFAGAAFAEPSLGLVEAGASADLVVLDYAPPAPLTEKTFGGHWMFGLSSRHVRDVIVNGELVVQDRRVTKVDQDKILAEASLAAGRLFARMDEIGPHPFAPAGAS
jgi:putative selenium metabolism protein SsnA